MLLPATVSEVLRALALFGAAVTVSDMLLTPLLGLLTHDAPLLAVQLQPDGAVTDTVLLPPAAAKLSADVETV